MNECTVVQPLLTSEVTSVIDANISIDKLNFRFSYRPSLAEMKLRWKEMGFKIVQGRVERGYHCIMIEGFEAIYILPNAKGEVVKIVTNPAKHGSIRKLQKTLRMICGDFYAYLIITRLDIAMDLPLPFPVVKRHLSVKYKQFTAQIEDRSGYGGGIRFGMNPEEVAVYDKHFEMFRRPGNLTRVEARLYSYKLPCVRLDDLPNSIHKVTAFKNIKLVPFKTIGVEELSGVKEAIKFGGFDRTLDFVGFAVTRRKFNLQGNFNRDFKKFFHEFQNPVELHPIFHDGIAKILTPALVQF